jgi:tetratricopeptide (TPR) repeat protein/tRNA A-37 threonylcarbamoyl transferase component Bud32
MIGTTVSHYKILEKLGEGGMGEVYLAEDTKLKRQVALKFLSEDLTRDEARKQRFIQEARAAAAIEHPHIAAIHDIDEVGGRTFIAMEHVGGESLRAAIAAKKLNQRKSLDLAIQIAEGLSVAHQSGIVHRDLKPENLLISEHGYAKIIDFGLAKLLEPLTKSVDGESQAETETKLATREGVIMGTVAYMSPEQARGAKVDARTDIFSFGVVLHEMLSGESPFLRATAVESLHAVMKETAAPLNLSGAAAPELQRILRKAMAKDPEERYQSMKDLTIDLRELREGYSSVERPAVDLPSAAKTPWKWAAVLAIAVAVAAVGWSLIGRDRGPPGIGAAGRPAVAVMYFESLSGDEEIRWLSKGLPNMLITDLAQTPGLDVVSSQRINEVLKQVGEENLESIDKRLVADIARRAGAGAVVVGSIFKSGAEVRIDVQVEDVGSGRILSAQSVQGEDVFPLVDELTGRIRSSLQMGDSPAGRPLADVTTRSLEAFQLYAEGLEAHMNVRYADARKLLEQAIEIDPSFGMAYFTLSQIARRLGESSLGAQYHEKALEHLERLPGRQKLLIQSEDAWRVKGEPEKGAELLETLIARYPDEEEAYYALSRIYGQRNQLDKMMATRERSVTAIPSSGPLHNDYGYALLNAGRYPEAIRELETYARLSPDEPNPHDSLGEAYLITGQPEKAIERYARALEVDPTFGVSHTSRAWASAMLGRYDEALAERAKAASSPNPGLARTTLLLLDAFTLSRVGRYQDAEHSLREGIETASSQSNIAAHAELELLAGTVALEKGNYSKVLENVGRAQEKIPRVVLPARKQGETLTANLLNGVAEARRGNLEAARAHLESQSKIYDPSSEIESFLYEALRGELALAANHLAEAEVAFSKAEPELKMFFSIGAAAPTLFLNNHPSRDGLARVKKAQGDLAAAIEIYRQLLTPDMSSKWTAMLEPRYVLELARLLDESGDKEGARAEYQRFLDLWKDADEGLPELKEARAYVAK